MVSPAPISVPVLKNVEYAILVRADLSLNPEQRWSVIFVKEMVL
jgi:hypothetical protein